MSIFTHVFKICDNVQTVSNGTALAYFHLGLDVEDNSILWCFM